MAPVFGITVKGLDRAERLPGQIEVAGHATFATVEEGIVRSVAERAPGGAGGSIGASVYAKRFGAKAARLSSDHPGAKAHERGAYIVPKGGRALRFADGSFRMRARLRAKHYFRDGVKAWQGIVAAAFKAHFGRLK